MLAEIQGKTVPIKLWTRVLMLHSGSRNIGKTLAEVHMARARGLAHNDGLPDRDLAVFLAGTSEYSVRDLAFQTAGIECRKDEGVLDEIPQAYKDIDRVMKNQADLVEIVAELRQVLCVKG